MMVAQEAHPDPRTKTASNIKGSTVGRMVPSYEPSTLQPWIYLDSDSRHNPPLFQSALRRSVTTFISCRRASYIKSSLLRTGLESLVPSSPRLSIRSRYSNLSIKVTLVWATCLTSHPVGRINLWH